MNSPAKVIFGVIFAIVAIYVVLHVVLGVVSAIMGLVYAALPVLIIVGIGYGLYRVFSPRALGGGRRILP